MQGDTQYYPNDGQYFSNPYTIYAEYCGACPNPCRKYHVSADIAGAETIAGIVLPYLAARKIFHKVVQRESFLTKQTAGDQAGKFITIYMPHHVEQHNQIIRELGDLLARLRSQSGIEPCPQVPRSRHYHHVFIEQPLDEGMFIYGGFVCDPTD